MLWRLTKWCVAVCLLPFCWAVAVAFVRLLTFLYPLAEHATWRGAAWLAGGFLAWVLVYLFLSRPVRAYIWAHELTHALWGTAMGAKVSNLNVREDGGGVTVSKTNFIISLAPYFFPFYTMLIIAVYAVAGRFWNVRAFEPLWWAVVGFTWAFHVTFTISTLLKRQPDVEMNGRLFSYVIIFIFNVLGVGFWVVAVTPLEFGFWLRLMHGESVEVYRVALQWVARGVGELYRLYAGSAG